MSSSQRKYFEESVDHIQGSTVLLDVDGTLLPDGYFDIDPRVQEVVEKLLRSNSIYLVSNGKNSARVGQLAQQLGVVVAPAGAPAGKPRLSSVQGIPTDKPFVVVGDMFITDGLLARRLRAPFVRVVTKHPTKRAFHLRFSHFIDDVVSLFV